MRRSEKSETEMIAVIVTALRRTTAALAAVILVTYGPASAGCSSSSSLGSKSASPGASAVSFDITPAPNQRVFLTWILAAQSQPAPSDIFSNFAAGPIVFGGTTTTFNYPYDSPKGSSTAMYEVYSPEATGLLGTKVTVSFTGIPPTAGQISISALGCLK